MLAAALPDIAAELGISTAHTETAPLPPAGKGLQPGGVLVRQADVCPSGPLVHMLVGPENDQLHVAHDAFRTVSRSAEPGTRWPRHARPSGRRK